MSTVSPAPTFTEENCSLAHWTAKIPNRPLLSACLILIADLVSLFLIIFPLFGSLIARSRGNWAEFWPGAFLLLFLYWLFDLYPALSISPVNELKRLTLANTVAFFCLAAILSMAHADPHFGAIITAWMVSSALIPLCRGLVRKLGSSYDWWGYPAVIFGNGEAARTVAHKLQHHLESGLWPVTIRDDRVNPIDKVELRLIAARGVRHALIVAPKVSTMHSVRLIECVRDVFPNVMVFQEADAIWNESCQTRNVVGMLAIQIRNNLLMRGSQITKRIIDLAVCFMTSLIVLPVMFFVSILIMVDSDGPVFYSQKRVGQNGRTFYIWKFRTMVRDATDIFNRQILTDSKLSKEWAETQKLRDDPRITRVGRLLRKTSLDELPQLWNVIRGEMSLVGPRPLPVTEISKYRTYGSAYELYEKVTPGLTGLWQVSGRSRTTYVERVEYDTYYIRNWSVWMDIYLLASTIRVVFNGSGAY